MIRKKHGRSILILRKVIRKIAYGLRIKRHETTATYKKLIPPEVQSGRFFELIQEISAYSNVCAILEIGSSSGEGSTRALLESLAKIPSASKQVHCMEISRERHQKLKEYLDSDSRFYPHRLSSVSTSEFPPFRVIENFYKTVNSKLSEYELDTIKSWYIKDLKFLNENPGLIPVRADGQRISGISWIKDKYSIDSFDFVIIDGGEFTGSAEFAYCHDSRYVALDDTNSFKTWDVRKQLYSDPRYKLIDENGIERNGWAIFEKVN
jgi:hypothetical protein